MPNFIDTGVASNTHLTFFIDGEAVGRFNHLADPSTTEFEYNQLVFSATALAETQHTFILANHDPAGSLVLFDYAIYRQA